MYFNVHVKGACYDFNTYPIEVKFSNVDYTFQRPVLGILQDTPDWSEVTVLGLSNKRNPVQFPGFKFVLGWQFIFLATPGDEYFEKLLNRSSRMFDNVVTGKGNGGLGGLVQQMNHIMDGVTSIQQPTL